MLTKDYFRFYEIKLKFPAAKGKCGFLKFGKRKREGKKKKKSVSQQFLLLDPLLSIASHNICLWINSIFINKQIYI